jgi:hypothetical protein
VLSDHGRDLTAVSSKFDSKLSLSDLESSVSAKEVDTSFGPYLPIAYTSSGDCLFIEDYAAHNSAFNKSPDTSTKFDDSFLFDNSHLVSSVKSVPTMTTSSPVTSEPNLPSVPPINPNSPLPSSYEANTRSAS